MIYYTLPLLHKQATLEMVGGKGMSLSKLLTAGIPVPEGFHVTTTSYKIFVEKNHIQPHINKLLDGIDSNNTSQLENVSTQIGMLFHNGEMPQEVSDAINFFSVHRFPSPLTLVLFHYNTIRFPKQGKQISPPHMPSGLPVPA